MIGKIIVVDVLLAGDNAVVIGMAVSKLEDKYREKAIMWGHLRGHCDASYFCHPLGRGVGIHSGSPFRRWSRALVDCIPSPCRR
mgnify:CR=1 FL=1